MDKHIQAQVDKLLLEQGEYSALELLLLDGRLLYSDYEAWRGGEFEYLDQVLFGDPEHIFNQLLEAEAYAKHLGLQVEACNYRTWHNSTSRTLKFSDNVTLNQCFHHRYRKAQDLPQMDLFYDAAGNNLYNGIIDALNNRDTGEAQRLLESLYDTEPDHARIGDLENMLEATERLESPVNDAACEQQWLENQLLPLAESLFGNTSRHILVPHWRRLTMALASIPFNPAQPQQHTSFTAMQALDWSAARNAIEGEANWQTDEILLQRHAHVCSQLLQHSDALLSWFRLCWRYPESTEEIEQCANVELTENWGKFLDLEPELAPGSFPAWLLLVKPGLVKILPQPESGEAYPSFALPFIESYAVIYRLLNNETQNASSADNGMALRARLKQLDKALFTHFLRIHAT